MKYCGQCGAELEPGGRFCGQCGVRVDQFAATPPPPSTPSPNQTTRPRVRGPHTGATQPPPDPEDTRVRPVVAVRDGQVVAEPDPAATVPEESPAERTMVRRRLRAVPDRRSVPEETQRIKPVTPATPPEPEPDPPAEGPTEHDEAASTETRVIPTVPPADDPAAGPRRPLYADEIASSPDGNRMPTLSEAALAPAAHHVPAPPPEPVRHTGVADPAPAGGTWWLSFGVLFVFLIGLIVVGTMLMLS